MHYVTVLHNLNKGADTTEANFILLDLLCYLNENIQISEVSVYQRAKKIMTHFRYSGLNFYLQRGY